MIAFRGLFWCIVLHGTIFNGLRLVGGFGSPLQSQISHEHRDGNSPKAHRSTTRKSSAIENESTHGNANDGDTEDPWIIARKDLRDPSCCVVSVCTPDSKRSDGVASLQAHLRVLQQSLADKGPSDLDLRAKIDTTTWDSVLEDCLEVCASIREATLGHEEDTEEGTPTLACAKALAELALGMASFAEDCNHTTGSTENPPSNGVFVRIVCASSYKAHDPVFHTDKAPLRGYATLRGVGTEFFAAPCSPPEYLSLRTLGRPLVPSSQSLLVSAREQEFIVMKGDYYYSPSMESPSATSWWKQRDFACVHRSPPGNTGSGGSSRRVIVSFDLDDGNDEREWFDAHQKRQWRAGMTQRKSKLVA